MPFGDMGLVHKLALALLRLMGNESFDFGQIFYPGPPTNIKYFDVFYIALDRVCTIDNIHLY